MCAAYWTGRMWSGRWPSLSLIHIYLEDHPDMTVVVSGGQGPDEPTSEAQAMADYLTAHGVEEEKVLLEPDSHNTAQNLDYSRRLLDREGIDTSDGVLLVSNGFHLTRARMLAERAGFEQVSTLAAPASHLPSRLYMYVREPLALVCLLYTSWLGP